MPVYSFSQIQLHNQCPLRYRYKYIDKIPEGEKELSPDLFLGKAVHEVLEMLYKRLNEMQKPTFDELEAWYEQLRSEWDDESIVLREGQTKESYHRRGSIYLKEYWQKYAPFENVKVVSTEMNITFSLDDDNTLQFRGVIDRLDKDGKAFIINDYKTNKRLPPEDKTYYQEQLTLYALGVKQKYGKYTDDIKARLHYLHFDLVDEWSVDETMLTSVTEKYGENVREIEQKRFHYNMGDKSVFPAVENIGCSRCPYQSICPLFAHASLDEEVQLGESTVKKMIDEYGRVTQRARAVDKEKKGLKVLLETYMKQSGFDRIYGDEYQISSSKLTNYSIRDDHAVRIKADELGKTAELVKVDRFALARLIKEGDISLDELGDAVEKKETLVCRVGKKK